MSVEQVVPESGGQKTGFTDYRGFFAFAEPRADIVVTVGKRCADVEGEVEQCLVGGGLRRKKRQSRRGVLCSQFVAGGGLAADGLVGVPYEMKACQSERVVIEEFALGVVVMHGRGAVQAGVVQVRAGSVGDDAREGGGRKEEVARLVPLGGRTLETHFAIEQVQQQP